MKHDEDEYKMISKYSEDRSHFPRGLETWLNILFNIKVNILVLNQWSYRSLHWV